MNKIQDDNFKIKFIAYSESFLNSLTNTISTYYGQEADEIVDKGYPWLYLVLYKKKLGKDLSISVFCSDDDFFVFFTKPTSEKIRMFVNKYGDAKFDTKWTQETPQAVRTQHVKDILKLDSSITIGEVISIPGGRFINNDISDIRRQAEGHGQSFGEKYGEMAKHYLPQLRAMAQNTGDKLVFNLRYNGLKNNTSKLTPQQIGHEFERLFRDVLNMYGWQARKINLSGEGNDFTAIFDGHHILGETRWEKNPVNGEAVNAFAGKLNARPQTIGLMVSYAGFDKGAYDAAKRHTSNRTIVFFEQEQIEKIITQLIDPGEVFSIELRDVYDYLFEKVDKFQKKK